MGEVLCLQGALPEGFLVAAAVEQSLEGPAQGSSRMRSCRTTKDASLSLGP